MISYMKARFILKDQNGVTKTPKFIETERRFLKNTVEKYRDDVYNSFYEYFRNYTKLQLTPVHQMLIRAAFKFEKIGRRQFLVQEGDMCKYICFVISGALRIYSVNERGQEAVVTFAIEQNWISDWESVVAQTPSRYYIDAVEDSEILQISPVQLHALETKVPAINEFLRLEQRVVAVATQKRIHAAISMNAEERYRDLLEHHPEYFQKFSQNMIASYLGITAETLSRLRKR
ncbi:Crp/Fnr family transcriptional regulator [Sphingobacterium faecium]|uniref:Crp/Fnr family transcriptional regulator n=1 Tax=Sphingobacterium faecium TaxID=34087 RepID=UPI0021B6E475|nr:Crp/Fnr family transcriptional regulator [Sphingobacterium faecium]UXD69394.1 Crp/Fnr family transcriptional regulator [Sphingobacterium faecium]